MVKITSYPQVQKTIIGPILFILYRNDLLNCMPDDYILLNTDDTVILSFENTWITAQNRNNAQKLSFGMH